MPADGHVICVSDTAEMIYVEKTWVVLVSVMIFATVREEQVDLQGDETSTVPWTFTYNAQENAAAYLRAFCLWGHEVVRILTGRYGVKNAAFDQEP